MFYNYCDSLLAFQQRKIQNLTPEQLHMVLRLKPEQQLCEKVDYVPTDNIPKLLKKSPPSYEGISTELVPGRKLSPDEVTRCLTDLTKKYSLQIENIMQQGVPSYLVICRIDDEVGHGVFTIQDVHPDTVLCLYGGTVVANTNQQYKALQQEDDAFFDFSANTSVTTKWHRGIGSYFQHFPDSSRDEDLNPKEWQGEISAEICQGNVSLQPIIYKNTWMLCLITKTKIPAGEQLGFSYGLDFFRERKLPPKFFSKKTKLPFIPPNFRRKGHWAFPFVVDKRGAEDEELRFPLEFFIDFVKKGFAGGSRLDNICPELLLNDRNLGAIKFIPPIPTYRDIVKYLVRHHAIRSDEALKEFGFLDCKCPAKCGQPTDGDPLLKKPCPKGCSIAYCSVDCLMSDWQLKHKFVHQPGQAVINPVQPQVTSLCVAASSSVPVSSIAAAPRQLPAVPLPGLATPQNLPLSFNGPLYLQPPYLGFAAPVPVNSSRASIPQLICRKYSGVNSF